ncbi:MAG: dipeptide/oligopeptide/nickel ABC transporter ATP-binding protein [Deltaproteobacteria bacterium]|jgi:ABC-type glutathione transport system ATPase component|nr:dipeptide/oligopeptide/nickel ABC transporter ATP-binding protein [Deltaproteobacteria bacterium]
MAGPVLDIRDLSVTFRKNGQLVKAVNGVSLRVDPGECYGLVGGSGCGKSTLARLVARLKDADSGSIFLEGEDVTRVSGKGLKSFYRKVQMVFQDPVSSFDPRKKIGQSIIEVMGNFSLVEKPRRREAVAEALEMVGLSPDYGDRLPGQTSGGQCQRAALAKAIVARPKLLICDEVTSALDVSVQAQIIALLRRLQADLNMAIIFISHDLALVRCFTTRLGVMLEGQIVETGPSVDVVASPKNEHTRLLLSSLFPVPKKVPTTNLWPGGL